MRALRIALAIASGGVALVALAADRFGAASPLAADPPARLAFSAKYARPLLFTTNGALLLPSQEEGKEDARWSAVDLPPGEVALRDLYAEPAGRLWVTGDHGLYTYAEDRWTRVDGVPGGAQIEAMHGYTYVFAGESLYRGPKDWRALDLPIVNAPAPPRDFVMLADHSHATLAGDVLRTHDMGLSWERIPAPELLHGLAADADGHLLALAASGLLRWRLKTRGWSLVAAPPNGAPLAGIQLFGDDLYALDADGALYRLRGRVWEAVEIAPGVRVRDLGRRQLRELWALDADNARLWMTTDGAAWASVDIAVVERAR